jgi:hypothetical protein
MKTSHLHDVWSSPDNSRLVSKQFSFRLPVHIAAKIAALGDMYPQKNRTQIVADLLSAALDDLEKNLPYSTYLLSEQEQDEEREIAHHARYDYEPMYGLGGVRGRYRETVNKYYCEFEKELGNNEPVNVYGMIYGTESSIKENAK